MALKVFNTLAGKKEEFAPLEKGKVKMYVCGPTVYDLSHIGHARSAVSFDAIYRYLRYSGYKVEFAKNYTDIDDKIIARAHQEGLPWDEIARRYIEAYDIDMTELGVETPTHRPKATETIEEMINLIKTLLHKGYAYTVNGDVYFSVRKFRGYGKLSGKNIEELEAGARVEVDERKEDPLDFALWKKSKPGEPFWESPFSRGRPGWHIECSAMCVKLFGPTLDVHGGGKDLIFPHHENEIAQSEGSTGAPFVRYWLHNGFVNIEKVKMSKSLGNILTVREVLKTHTAESVRLFLLSSHYRSPIDYSAESLREAEAKTERFYRTLERMEKECLKREVSEKRFEARMRPIITAMDDDFNTAAAIGLIFEEVLRANTLMDRAKRGLREEEIEEFSLIRRLFAETAKFLGVFAMPPGGYFAELKKRSMLPAQEIELLIKERDEARRRKDFKRADAIRDELKEKGIALEDTPCGTVWTVR
jgi:cysteinyl-tRNA synthetase